MKKRLLSISLTLCMIVANISALGVFALAEEAEDYTASPEVATEQAQEEEAIEEIEEPVSTLSASGDKYLTPVYKDGDYKNGLLRMEEKQISTNDILSGLYYDIDNKCNLLCSGTYYVDGEVKIDKPLRIDGQVHLILKDGCYLGADSIILGADDSIDIYGQESNTGTLKCYGINNCEKFTTGHIIINGGHIISKGYSGSGIGGDTNVEGSNIVINGGKVEARASLDGAAIGGGKCSEGHDIHINGGEVYADSDRSTYYSDEGSAGIGGSAGEDGYNIYILGGKVTAIGGNYSAGIGGSSNNKNREDYLSGGGHHIYISRMPM